MHKRLHACVTRSLLQVRNIRSIFQMCNFFFSFWFELWFIHESLQTIISIMYELDFHLVKWSIIIMHVYYLLCHPKWLPPEDLPHDSRYYLHAMHNWIVHLWLTAKWLASLWITVVELMLANGLWSCAVAFLSVVPCKKCCWRKRQKKNRDIKTIKKEYLSVSRKKELWII